MKKTLISLVLCLVCICFATGAFAIEFRPNASTLIMSCGVYISNSGTTITADTSIATRITADELGFSYIRIQEQRGASWVTVKSVTDKYKLNGSTYTYSISYAGTAGNVYRAMAGFYAEDAGESDSRSGTSSTITAN